MPTLEIGQLNLKHENCRLQDREIERRLVSSLAERGQDDPIEGVHLADGQFLVLNGFKRVRSSKLIGKTQVECQEIGSDEVEGIFGVLRADQKRSLHILEQAQWMQELRGQYKVGVSDIAQRLERSPAWVSVRLGMLQEMTSDIRKEIFSGRFPVRAYMYAVRHFTRVKRVPVKEAEDFVKAVGGKGMSTRNIELLARGFFQGGDAFRQQIKEGNLNWCLEKLNQVLPSREDPQNRDDLNELEQRVLKDLRFSQDIMERLTQPKRRHIQGDLQAPTFFAEAELLTSGVLRRMPPFQEAIQKLYDQCRDTKNRLGTLPEGPSQEANCGSAGT